MSTKQIDRNNIGTHLCSTQPLWLVCDHNQLILWVGEVDLTEVVLTKVDPTKVDPTGADLTTDDPIGGDPTRGDRIYRSEDDQILVDQTQAGLAVPSLVEDGQDTRACPEVDDLYRDDLRGVVGHGRNQIVLTAGLSCPIQVVQLVAGHTEVGHRKGHTL